VVVVGETGEQLVVVPLHCVTGGLVERVGGNLLVGEGCGFVQPAQAEGDILCLLAKLGQCLGRDGVVAQGVAAVGFVDVVGFFLGVGVELDGVSESGNRQTN